MRHSIERILLETKTSKTKFAKDTGISKPFIINVIEGRKKCSQNLYDAICRLDYVTLKQKEELTKAYFSQLFTKNEFNLLNQLIVNLENFEDKYKGKIKIRIREGILEKTIFNSKAPYAFGSKAEFIEIISYFCEKCFENDNPFFYTNYSFYQQELDAVLFSKFYDRDFSKEIDFIHLSNFNHNADISDIDTIFYALNWSKALINTYVCQTKTDNGSALFPYYFITNLGVFVFNESYDSGFLYTDESSISYYIDCFNQIRQNYYPLCTLIEDEAVLIGHNDIIKCMGNITGVYGYFCNATLTYDMYNEIARDFPQRELHIDMLINHYKSSNTTEYISENVLWKFVETGNVENITDKYANPFSKEGRARVLEHLKNTEEHPTHTVEIIDDNKLKIPEHTILCTTDNTVIYALLYSNEPFMKAKKMYQSMIIIPTELFSGYQNLSNNFREYIERTHKCFDPVTRNKTFDSMIIKCK